MDASPKMQGEIDRVLKKVQECMNVFDSIWNKVFLIFDFNCVCWRLVIIIIICA